MMKDSERRDDVDSVLQTCSRPVEGAMDRCEGWRRGAP